MLHKTSTPMKKLHRLTVALSICFICSTSVVWAQPGGPPPPNHNSEGNQEGGRAPIGSGIFILLSLSGAYGGYKVYQTKKDQLS